MNNSEAATRHSRGETDGRAFLFMLASSLAFATMGAFSHLAGERADCFDLDLFFRSSEQFHERFDDARVADLAGHDRRAG